MLRDVYGEMQRGQFKDPNYRMVTNPQAGFYQLQLQPGIMDGEGNNLSNVEDMMGDWKFHLSVNPNDVPRAWNIVSDTLINSGYASLAKVVNPKTSQKFSNPESIQSGKHITIYTYKGLSDSYYSSLIQEIEDKFAKEGIRPGPRQNADRIIPGGQYSSYRLENGPNGEYVASSDLAHLPRERRYNPWGTRDPFKDLNINHNNNLQKQTSYRAPIRPDVEAVTPQAVSSSRNDAAQRALDEINRALGREGDDKISMDGRSRSGIPAASVVQETKDVADTNLDAGLSDFIEDFDLPEEMPPKQNIGVLLFQKITGFFNSIGDIPEHELSNYDDEPILEAQDMSPFIENRDSKVNAPEEELDDVEQARRIRQEQNKIIDVETLELESAVPIEELMLQPETKAIVDDYLGLIDFQEVARERGINLPTESHQNMLLTGVPGIGKSTLAKSIGMELKDKFGEDTKVYFVKASELIGSYLGQTENKTQAILDAAKDGVLIIDEIDTLVSKSGDLDSGYGAKALHVINTHLGDKPNFPRVIGTLYDSNLDGLLNVNEGFRSRFSNVIQMKGQSDSDLVNIFERKMKQSDLSFDPKIKEPLKNMFAKARDKYGDNFGYIRAVNNVIGSIMSKLNDRFQNSPDNFKFHVEVADLPSTNGNSLKTLSDSSRDVFAGNPNAVIAPSGKVFAADNKNDMTPKPTDVTGRTRTAMAVNGF